MSLLETPGHSQASLGESLVGSLLLSPGSWCAPGFVCALQESVSSVLWKFCNQIPLASKAKFPGGSQFLCQIPRLGNLLCVLEFIWYNCSAVCGSSAQQLCGGVSGNLLQEGLCHMPCVPSLLHPVLLPLQQAAVDPYLHRRHSDREAQAGIKIASCCYCYCC